MRRGLLALLVALASTPAAYAGGPSMLVGAAEDVVKQPTLVGAQAQLNLLRLAGFGAVRVTAIWAPGDRKPSESELEQIGNVAAAAELTGMGVFVAVYQFGSRTTPLTDTARTEFADFAAAIAREVPGVTGLIIGNEPNLNRFWMPQFNLDGSDAAAPAYLALLAETYDAVKAANPEVTVIGGAVSPRGSDRPGTIRDTHSPTVFLRDLGAAYRASGRAEPVMDWLAIHPYPDNSSQPPSFAHPNTTSIGIADYGKLVALLGDAFDGTPQRGSTLPILYGEFGVEATVPEAKSSLYTGVELTTTKAVTEDQQAAFYREAVSLSFCQPNVVGIMVFHAFDESALDRFQSGVYYADGKPKSSLGAVRAAARDSRGGVIARCEGLRLTPRAKVVYPGDTDIAAGRLTLRVTCDIDCNVYTRLEKLPRRSTTLAVRGRGRAGETATVAFPPRRVAPGRYRVTVRLTAPVNTGPPRTLASSPLRVAP